MPTCHACGKYYSVHARWCPSCYTDQGRRRNIQSAVELPVPGSTYVNEHTGARVTIDSVELVGDVLYLGLQNGALVTFPVSTLREVPSISTLAQTEAA